MNFRQVSELSDDQRKEKLKEIKIELMKERAMIASGTAPKNPGMIQEHRKTVARIKTAEKQVKQ